jgi:Tol biopolymer transport system component
MSERRPATRGVRDPFGIGPSATLAAPAAAFVGLVVVAILTVGLMTGDLPLPGGGNGEPDGGGPGRTPAPSDVVIVDPRTEVPGSIAYVKAGNVWVQSGIIARQVTDGGGASSPSWSPDGQWICYVETKVEFGRFPAQGAARRYELQVPNLMRVRRDGVGEELLATGKYTTSNGYTWFYWISDPVASPDGRTLAVGSDGPNPVESNVVIQLFDLEARTFSRPSLPETAPLGHQDPTWSADGSVLYYVRNDREGAAGRPAIFAFDLASGAVRTLTGPGYLAPSISPDGRFVAATRTDAFGTNVVILDGSGGEVLRVTDDDRSWSPAWSPRGDAIAFLHFSGGIADLQMVMLEGSGPRWTLGERLNLTEVSGLDGASAPRWFIPADELPPPTPPPATPAPSAAASGEASARASP